MSGIDLCGCVLRIVRPSSQYPNHNVNWNSFPSQGAFGFPMSVHLFDTTGRNAGLRLRFTVCCGDAGEFSAATPEIFDRWYTVLLLSTFNQYFVSEL